MGLILAILLYGGIAVAVFLFLIFLVFIGFLIGRSARKPEKGCVSFSTVVKKDVYDDILSKGLYESELQMVQDALDLLDWSLEVSRNGRHIVSCEVDGDSPEEYASETMLNIRESVKPVDEVDPVEYLNRCLSLDILNEEEGDTDTDGGS